MLWAASDWPIHDLGENYLYSVHMLQHMMLSYFLPPLALLATPEWLLRVLVGNGRAYAVLQLALPSGRRRRAVQPLGDDHPHPRGRERLGAATAPLHYLAPRDGRDVLAADVDARRRAVPRVPPQHDGQDDLPLPACRSCRPSRRRWLTFAEGVVYRSYGEQPVRVWGLSVTDDQQLAGAIMKVGGSVFLWSIIVVLWFRRFSASYRDEHDYRPRPPDADRPRSPATTRIR